jgi:hypothetical protein
MKPADKPNRNMVFVSHANPEDNAFAKWITLKLATQGYPVWCDLTKLLGGEDFWKDIEGAIRDRTIKFLFVLSKTSNIKPGTLMEIAVARKVGKKFTDFIIPLRIDDIKSDDILRPKQRGFAIGTLASKRGFILGRFPAWQSNLTWLSLKMASFTKAKRGNMLHAEASARAGIMMIGWIGY